MLRNKGWITVAQRRFTKPANVMSGVNMRVRKSEFRKLVKHRRMRVSIHLVTRGSDGQLRRTIKRVWLLAPRR